MVKVDLKKASEFSVKKYLKLSILSYRDNSIERSVVGSGALVSNGVQIYFLR